MQIKKTLAVLALAACMTSCSETDISSNTEGAAYGDTDVNIITFIETIGEESEASTTESTETNKIAETTTDSTPSDTTTAEITEPNITTETTTASSPSVTTEIISPKTPTITPTVLDRETDRRIRSDYAAYVSARDNTEISADTVTGQFYFGNDNGYMLLVMCPYDYYTLDEMEYKLPIMDIPDDDCDCYPYVHIILPSGMFQLLAYKDGTFTDINTAVNEKLISYDAISSIASYMDKFYAEGDQTCIYRTNYIDD